MGCVRRHRRCFFFVLKVGGFKKAVVWLLSYNVAGSSVSLTLCLCFSFSFPLKHTRVSLIETLTLTSASNSPSVELFEPLPAGRFLCT